MLEELGGGGERGGSIYDKHCRLNVPSNISHLQLTNTDSPTQALTSGILHPLDLSCPSEMRRGELF